MTVIYGLHGNVDGDPYWHIKLGEIMFKTKTILKHDVLSYSASGVEYINHEWFSDFILYFFYKFFGEPGGLMAFQFTFVFLFALMIFLIVRLFSNKLVYSFIAIPLVLLIDFSRILARPHIISDVLFALFIYLWERDRQSDNYKRLYILIPLTVLWTNIHGSFKIGVATLGIMWAGEFIEYIWKKDSRSTSANFIKHGGIVVALCILSTVINPWGIALHVFIYQTSFFGEMAGMMKDNIEWETLMSQRWFSLQYIPLLFFTCAAGFFANLEKARLSHVLAFSAIFALTLKAARFSPHLATISVLITAYNFYMRRIKVAAILTHVICVLLFIYSIYFYIHNFNSIIYPFTTRPWAAPRKIVDFLEENNIYGRPFYTWTAGGYLSFRRWPKQLVFMDGRAPVFKDFFYDYVKLVTRGDTDLFKKLNNKFDFDYILLPSRLMWLQFAVDLLNDKQWVMVYFEPNEGVLLLKDIPKFEKIIEKYKFKEPPAQLMPLIKR